MNTIPIVLAVVLVLTAIVANLIYAVKNAPLGYEDGNGFHFVGL